MEKEFVPHKQAVALKELGFNEPCLCSWNFYTNELNFNGKPSNFSSEDVIQLPTFSQAFRWFREKYNLTWEHQFDDSNISLYVGKITYPDNNLEFFKIIEVDYNGYNKAYEEAELECLKKLIEITKNK